MTRLSIKEPKEMAGIRLSDDVATGVHSLTAPITHRGVLWP
jgi:hypothetical protein